jgi:hypothetical protein
LSNELRKIVKEIQFKTDKTIGEIANDIGYARAYFTNQVSIGTNKNLLHLLREKYGLDNEQIVRNEEAPLSRVNEDPAEYNTVLPMGDHKVTLADYIELLKEKAREAKERERELMSLLKGDIARLKTNSKTILDDLSQVVRMVRSDDMSMMDSLDRIEGREPGRTRQEAGIVERAYEAEDEDNGTNDNEHTDDNSGKQKKQGS